jgi:hypothetical protein
MLVSYIYINYDEIDRVYMHNQGNINSKGQYEYHVWLESAKMNKKVVWHKRDEGWFKLLQKTLKKLEGPSHAK